jgi:rhamnopyranosyl-N-acetylglucosaminyl-diphospho-decaprenol beta-1,3/1,4-galactofuranosyltransferase
MDKVIAVVVTYNRQQLLSECVEAIRKQTRKVDKILIVNNGSTDSTMAWVSSQPDLELLTLPALGPGGGFNAGIKWGYDNGFSWIWLMDDDGYPAENALFHLLEDDSEELMLRNCAVLNKNDKKTFVWKTKNFKTIDDVNVEVIDKVAHPFNGTMLHRKIVERVGLPQTKLFSWGVETEYYFRITNLNAIPFRTYAKSIHYHPPCPYNFKSDFSYSSTWKMYFYVRNRFAIMKSQFSNNMALAYTMYILFLSMYAARVVLFQKTNKWQKLSFIIWPAKDAFLNRFDATPNLILERLQRKPSNVFGTIAEYFAAVPQILAGPNAHGLQEFDKAKAS